ncbi:response regulator [Capilliphycus salinus ALCB114379]|uniref:response regulator n=1 Tax=Capilliphycus salinus TaxID=2768948 RepID=UPI0039A76FA9
MRRLIAMNTRSFDNSTAKILVVDDTIDSLRLLSNMLSEQGYNVRKVLNGQMALTAAQAAPPDLILLDINMPQMNGYEVCQQLKTQKETAEIPVIFISALDEVLDKVKAFTVGGVDYITKPFQFEEVVARVETQLKIRFLQQQLSEIQQQSQTLQTQYQRLFNSGNAGIFQMTPDGFYQTVNPALVRLYGYQSADEMINDFLNLDDKRYVNQKRWRELMNHLEKEGSVVDFKSQVKRVDNHLIWISENIWAVRDEQGKVCCYEGSVILAEENDKKINDVES